MSVIRNGVFYKDGQPMPQSRNPNLKQWNHDRQRADHRQDIIQRYVHGKPNPEFIRAYPEESKINFTEDQIRKFGNNY